MTENFCAVEKRKVDLTGRKWVSYNIYISSNINRGGSRMFRKIGTALAFFLGLYCLVSGAQAAPFSQSEAVITFSDTLPAAGLYLFDSAASPPTGASLTNSGRDNGAVSTAADWWELNTTGSLHWNRTFHDVFNIWSATETAFLITAPGPAAIEFTWDSLLDITGQGIAGDFGVYSEYEVRDFGNNFVSDEYRFIEDDYGHAEHAVTFSFDYDFSPADVGQTLSIYRNLETGNWGRDSVSFSSPAGFADIAVESMLTISAFSGGLEQIGASAYPSPPTPGPVPTPPSPVPEPVSLLLFGSGMAGLAGFRRFFSRLGLKK